jgi:uncharacterized protein YbjQ (UPF0145 family)
MKKLLTILGCALLICAPTTHARNDFMEFSVESAFELDAYKRKLGDDVQFYFGTKHRGKVVKTFGTWPTQKKTNAFNKTDEYACQWALLSALLSLKKRAKAEGGNAVINIKTNNDHNERSSSETFECEVGNIIASVALVGTIVKLN